MKDDRLPMKQVLRISRRVLRLVDGYLATEDLDTLRTDGRGLLSYRELRRHIRVALRLRARVSR